MRTLVTGGSGFFGHLLIEKLLERGDEIVNFDLNPLDESIEGVETILGDIRDLDAVRKACEGAEVVHHNIAQQPLAKDKEAFRTVNHDGTNNILTAALGAGVKKLIYTSSTSIYGIPKSLPIKHDTVPTPVEAYGRSKVACESKCREFVEQGLDITLVRPRTIMGHGRLGIFQMLFEWIRQGYNIPVLGKGNNTFQFIHAADLAESCILAADRPGSTAYNIGTDRFGTMREVLEVLCEHAGTGSKVRGLPMKPAMWMSSIASKLGLSPLGAYHWLAYGYSNYFDVSKAQDELGWQPKFSNNEMLIESYDWYIANREDVLNSKWQSSPHRSAVKQGILGLAVRCL